MQLVTRGGEMVAAVGSGLALYWYVGNPGVVQGASMMPTFPACCSVVWFSALFRPHALRVGDVVSATVQGAFMEEVGVVKRVRGVAGDLVLDELSGGVVLVPEGCVWLLGDNAEESRGGQLQLWRFSVLLIWSSLQTRGTTAPSRSRPSGPRSSFRFSRVPAAFRRFRSRSWRESESATSRHKLSCPERRVVKSAVCVFNLARKPRAMRVASKRVVGAGKWIQLKELEVVDAKTGRSKQWESAERTGNQTAVAIFVRLFGGPLAEGCDETLLVKQFRPPVDRYVLENPAGLVDKGESAEEAALRELEEETGYHGVVTGTTSDIYCDPGMSDGENTLVFPPLLVF